MKCLRERTCTARRRKSVT